MLERLPPARGEELSDEDLADLEEAMEEYRRGESLSLREAVKTLLGGREGEAGNAGG